MEAQYLAFEQDGRRVEATLVDGVYEVALKATEFSIIPHPDLFEGDAFDSELGITVGRETLLRPQVQKCQSLIDGPLFEALNKYSVSTDPIATLFLDTPPRGGRFGWHGVGGEDPGVVDTGAITIKSIIDLKNDRTEILRAGEEIFLISYDFPPASIFLSRPCDPPAGTDTSQGVVDPKRMQLWRLVFK
ncbi:hypothetical protein [Parasphingorhabdus cellanae]|uniref:Uncharacterized protein n=1 Tax=Parasphingorhabdus cellanae TaxID=2806553 RepID=A0ABX7TAP4_9SPHN|nr:hypothetical protein [Parasphingorhabdus cellanae]QTD57600.1 hypothetical protein J4G78_08815 [Parasphingorhabdus cellanae]